MAKRLVVVGGVAGGTSAAAKAKRTNSQWDVVIFEKGPYVSYGGCGLPYYVEGEIEKKEDLVVRWPRQFREQGIEVYTHSEVKAIDVDKGEVEVYHAQEGQTRRYPFDALVVATGARPLVPPLPGRDLEGIYVLRTPDQGEAIRRELESGNVKKAVVVGGGFIGVEMCEALARWGVEVTVVELLDQILPPMDRDMADVVARYLEEKGVNILTGHGVEGFLGRDRVEKVVAGGEEIPADMVILSVGVRPNVDLAREAGIQLGSTGAIAANQRMETNVEGVYTAGDCAEARHIITGEPVYIPLGTTANKMGRVAGTNAVGGDAVFKGVLGTAVFKVMDLGGAMTGLTEKDASRRGIPYSVARITARDRAHYYPGGQRITVKLVYNSETGRLLGSQIVGRWTSVKRIDAVAVALYAGMTVEDFSRQDLAYAPPFSPVWDPLLVAANKAVR